MTVPIHDAIKLNIPDVVFGACLGPKNCNVVMRDILDGNGPFIGEWAVPGYDKPTPEQIKAWQVDANTIKLYTYENNKAHNKPIEDKLHELNVQSMVHVRRNNQDELQKIEALYQQLESTLLPIHD